MKQKSFPKGKSFADQRVNNLLAIKLAEIVFKPLEQVSNESQQLVERYGSRVREIFTHCLNANFREDHIQDFWTDIFTKLQRKNNSLEAFDIEHEAFAFAAAIEIDLDTPPVVLTVGGSKDLETITPKGTKFEKPLYLQEESETPTIPLAKLIKSQLDHARV